MNRADDNTYISKMIEDIIVKATKNIDAELSTKDDSYKRELLVMKEILDKLVPVLNFANESTLDFTRIDQFADDIKYGLFLVVGGFFDPDKFNYLIREMTKSMLPVEEEHNSEAINGKGEELVEELCKKEN